MQKPDMTPRHTKILSFSGIEVKSFCLNKEEILPIPEDY